MSGAERFFAELTAPRLFYSVPPPRTVRVPLVAVLREPVARAHAWFRHMVSAGDTQCTAGCKGWACQALSRCAPICSPDVFTGVEACRAHRLESVHLSFSDWIALHGARSLPAGIYAPQLWLWRQYFGQDLLLLSFDTLISQQEAQSAITEPAPPTLPNQTCHWRPHRHAKPLHCTRRQASRPS